MDGEAQLVGGACLQVVGLVYDEIAVIGQDAILDGYIGQE
jgi:hypothetical protein